MFKTTLIRLAVIFAGSLLAPWSSWGATVFNFTITLPPGQAGSIVFDYITSEPGRGNRADITNFSTNGALGLPTTQGGLVTGDIILGLNPAPFTTIATNSSFNELSVNYNAFGTLTKFGLTLTEIGPSASSPPDEFSLFVLDSTGQPLFPTADPTGADALITVDITGASGGLVNVFSPAVLNRANNTVTINFPSTPEPSSLLLTALGLAALSYARSKASRP